MKFQSNDSLLENKNKFSLKLLLREKWYFIPSTDSFFINDKGMPQHNGFLSSVQNLVKTRHREAIYFSPTKQL